MPTTALVAPMIEKSKISEVDSTYWASKLNDHVSFGRYLRLKP